MVQEPRLKEKYLTPEKTRLNNKFGYEKSFLKKTQLTRRRENDVLKKCRSRNTSVFLKHELVEKFHEESGEK